VTISNFSRPGDESPDFQHPWPDADGKTRVTCEAALVPAVIILLTF